MIKRSPSILALAALLSACAGTPTLQPPTTVAAAASNAQLIANTIRLDEAAGLNPAGFNALVDECVGMFPSLASKAATAKAEFARLYATGNADLANLEKLATQFDS